jgi:hypothetical protein
MTANPLLILGVIFAIFATLALIFLGVAMLSVFMAGFLDHHDSPNEGLFHDDIDLKQ